MSDLEAKAREIVENGPVIFGRESMAHYEAAILHALREERERAAEIADEAFERCLNVALNAERSKDPQTYGYFQGCAVECRDIAAAIRGEDNGC